MSKTLGNARKGKTIERWWRKAMDLRLVSYDCQATEDHIVRHRPGGVQGGKNVTTDHSNTLQVLAVAAMMEIEDLHVYAHCLRVAGYAVTIARRMQLSPAEVIAIEQAALLHDIGKVAVAGSILNKPAQLTKKEYMCVKQHSAIGEKVVQKVPELLHLAPLIRSHHERYDGKGYPDGTRSNKIPIGGRIIAVADAFDAMTSNRPYRKARSNSASANELLTCSGTQFDPVVVEVFLGIMREEQAPWRTLTEGMRSLLRMLLSFDYATQLPFNLFTGR